MISSVGEMIFKAIVLAVGVLLFCLFIRFTVKFFNILHVSSTSAPNGLIYTPTKNPGDPPIPLAFKRKRPKDPRTRSDYHPKAGIYLIDQLLAGQTGSVRTELRAFIESVRAQLRLYTNDEVRTLRQGKFQNIWQKFLAEEGVLYLRNRGRIPPNAGFELLDQEYPCEYTPGPHSFTIEKSRLTGVRPSGAPQSILHIILDKPTGKEGTYTHLSSPTLDPGNDTTRALMKKCLTSSSCFAFDHFSRRVITSRPRRFTVRNICGEWNHVHDKLHSEYRKLGGKVALIFGDQAFKAYLTVVEKENSVALESLTKNRRCGYTVLIERKKVRF